MSRYSSQNDDDSIVMMMHTSLIVRMLAMRLCCGSASSAKKRPHCRSFLMIHQFFDTLSSFCGAFRWDNRMPFEAWVAWCRCMYFQARRHEWPTTHGGLESLGAVHPSQRFRELSTSRSVLAAAANEGQT